MQVKDNHGFKGDVEGAILSEIELCVSGGGELENMSARIYAIQNLVARFISLKISTVEELNALVGWDKYSDAE